METVFHQSGAAYITGLIRDAVARGVGTVTVNGNYEIEEAVLIPSGITLILENCHLRMKDGTFDNMFRNQGARDDGTGTREMRDYDIHIIGRGRAILDGGEYNGLSETVAKEPGRPLMTVNNVIHFSNVERFSVEGLHIRNMRWWALCFHYCAKGILRDLDFLADCTRITEDGTRVEGLLKEKYAQTYVKNADGIDLRVGCHDFLIENITGFTEDDTVALTALPMGRIAKCFGVKGESPDIRNVMIRNVCSASFCANVRLLNQGGAKLYNILIDGVFDTSADSPCLDRGGTGVRIGDLHLYGDRHSTKDETFNITVRNVYSRAQRAMRICGQMTNCTFENICGFDGCDGSIEDHSEQFQTR